MPAQTYRPLALPPPDFGQALGVRGNFIRMRWFTMLPTLFWKAEEMQKVVVGLGELLWDMLPAGKRLGGAPANFTVMSSRLGNRGVIASRLGGDTLGARARAVLGTFPADISLLQLASTHPRGRGGGGV